VSTSNARCRPITNLQPIFGAPPTSPPEYAALKQHGFARTQTWKLEKILLDREEGVSVRLVAPPPPATFPHAIELHYVVTLAGHQLVSDLHVKNKGTEDFKFQALLHTYLAVPDISQVAVKGIDAGVNYADKTRGGEVAAAPGGPLTFTTETDRYVYDKVAWLIVPSVYRNLPTRDLIVDTGSGENYKVHFRGFEEYVFKPGSRFTDALAARSGTLPRPLAARLPTWRRAAG
jgi:glucose-6-phosphate 1-epimerase